MESDLKHMEFFLKSVVAVSLKRTEPNSEVQKWFQSEMERLAPEINTIWNSMGSGEPNPWTLAADVFGPTQ